MAYTTFDLSTAQHSYLIDVHEKSLVVVKVKTSRWLLCEQDGTVQTSKRSETEVLQRAAKIEERRINGNLHGFRFGSKIEESTVLNYAIAVWGERFDYSNIEFDGHYWWADISEKGNTAEHLRMDYHINYERTPEFGIAA